MRIRRSFLNAALLSVILALPSHADERGWGGDAEETRDVLYTFCDGHHHGINENNKLILKFQRVLNNRESKPEGIQNAWENIASLRGINKDLQDNLEFNRRDLSRLNFTHGSCGIEL